ncbi:MAG: hypothetical protein ACOCXJ_08190 [Planctomycetota bacterium]
MRHLVLILITGLLGAAEGLPLSVEDGQGPLFQPAVYRPLRIDIDASQDPDGMRLSAPAIEADSAAFFPDRIAGPGHYSYLASTGSDWTEHHLRLLPAGDGELGLILRATFLDAMHVVDWDDLRVSGARLSGTGDFEDLDEAGMPMGWEERGQGAVPAGVQAHAADVGHYLRTTWSVRYRTRLTGVTAGAPIELHWRSRFVSPEQRYHNRIGLSGLTGADVAQRVRFTCHAGRRIDPSSTMRYSRLDDQRPEWAGERVGRDALAVYLAEAQHQWLERMLVLEPLDDGDIRLVLQGARHVTGDRLVPMTVLYDRVVVEGATIDNGDFEELGPDGLPLGWERVGADVDFDLMEHADAASGAHAVRTWYQAGLATCLRDVRAGRQIRIHLLTRLPGPPPPQGPPRGPRIMPAR